MIRHRQVILSLLVFANLGSANAADICETLFDATPGESFQVSIGDLERSRKFLRQIDKKNAVAIYGSARLPETHPAYRAAFRFTQLLAQNGKATVTGGGLGIMKAANAGAKSMGGKSYGVIIHLPHEQTMNLHLDDYVSHKDLFTRMEVFVRSSSAHVFFQGGLGTLQEVTLVLSLIQNRQMAKEPVVLVDRAYWAPLVHLLQESLLKGGTISKEDMELFVVVDTPEQAYQAVTKWHDLTPNN